MPAIRELSIGKSLHAVEVVDTAGTARAVTKADVSKAAADGKTTARAVTKADVSKAAADGKTTAQIEAIMDEACAKADYVIVSHVFSLDPFDVALMATDAGAKVAADWWTRPAKIEASPRAHFEARRKEDTERAKG